MKKLGLIFILLFVFTNVGSLSATTSKQSNIDKYKKRLETTTNARDSVRILYNLFDLSDRENQKKYAWQLYETAGRAADLSPQLDMLRNLAVFYQRNDSVLDVLKGLADQIPNDDARASTKTFILNQQISAKSANPDDKTFERMLLDSITHSHNLVSENKYDQISLLFQIIQYLGVDSDGALFKEILDKYATIIDELPSSDYPLKNQLYTTSAIIYSRLNEDGEKSIQYDKKLIEITDLLKQMYSKRNRKFRSYDTNKFICYRRMLSNYRALSRNEVEEIYDSAMALYQRNPDVRASVDKYGFVGSYYYMATEDYAKALPALKKTLLNDDLSIYQRRKCYYMLSQAAEAVGDKETKYNAMEHYISLSRKIDSLRKVSIDREIMIRDIVEKSPVLSDVSNYSHEKKKEKNSQGNNNIPLTIIACALAALLIIYMVLYFRLRMKK